MTADLPETPEPIHEDRDRAGQGLDQRISELGDRADIPAGAETEINEPARGAQHRTVETGHVVDDVAHDDSTRAGQLVENPTPSVSEPLQDVGKQVADSARGNRVPVAAIAAGSAAVLTWIILRRRRT
ncbi:hypothetical protein ACIBG0_35380 [Nocardia sp. NPDC050630]|uniref:hypothetical protein n=1 Tax=Nocardia sp. NPDC050630 TaxID=3364321 RepID=UPI003798FC97